MSNSQDVVEPIIANNEEKLYKDRMKRALSLHYEPVSMNRGMHIENSFGNETS